MFCTILYNRIMKRAMTESLSRREMIIDGEFHVAIKNKL